MSISDETDIDDFSNYFHILHFLVQKSVTLLHFSALICAIYSFSPTKILNKT